MTPILKQCTPKDIFTMYDTVLYHIAHPNITLSIKGERCHRGKSIKTRDFATVLQCKWKWKTYAFSCEKIWKVTVLEKCCRYKAPWNSWVTASVTTYIQNFIQYSFLLVNLSWRAGCLANCTVKYFLARWLDYWPHCHIVFMKFLHCVHISSRGFWVFHKFICNQVILL